MQIRVLALQILAEIYDGNLRRKNMPEVTVDFSLFVDQIIFAGILFN